MKRLLKQARKEQDRFLYLMSLIKKERKAGAKVMVSFVENRRLKRALKRKIDAIRDFD